MVCGLPSSLKATLSVLPRKRSQNLKCDLQTSLQANWTHLWLRSSKGENWGPGAPAGLHTLDLSYNLLEALPPCSGPVLPGLRTLALGGNPLRALQTGAFACFPALRLLNLSCTALGRGDHAGIADAAFAGAGGAPLAALEVLDLSGTFLRRGECGRRVSSPRGWRSGEKGL